MAAKRAWRSPRRGPRRAIPQCGYPEVTKGPTLQCFNGPRRFNDHTLKSVRTVSKQFEATLDEGHDEEWEGSGGRRRDLDALSGRGRLRPATSMGAGRGRTGFQPRAGKRDDVAPSAARGRRRLGCAFRLASPRDATLWVSARSSVPLA